MVGTGLGRVNTTHRKQHERAVQNAKLAERRRAEEARVRAQIEAGAWHDGRLDCLAGNGVMSELGVGDEAFHPEVVGTASSSQEKQVEGGEKRREEPRQQERSEEDVQAIEAMPIVIVKGFETKGGGASKEELLDVLSRWAASLAQNQVRFIKPRDVSYAQTLFQVAHVIVVSENRENAKRLAKGMLAHIRSHNVSILNCMRSTTLTAAQPHHPFRRGQPERTVVREAEAARERRRRQV